jgi:hypothetical protein
MWKRDSHAIRNDTVEERTSVAEQSLTHKAMNSTLKWMNDCKMFGDTDVFELMYRERHHYRHCHGGKRARFDWRVHY